MQTASLQTQHTYRETFRGGTISRLRSFLKNLLARIYFSPMTDTYPTPYWVDSTRYDYMRPRGGNIPVQGVIPTDRGGELSQNVKELFAPFFQQPYQHFFREFLLISCSFRRGALMHTQDFSPTGK